MGMFDSLLCETPLPDGYTGEFQTKDFDCTLSTYRIGADGKLYLRDYEWEDAPDAPLGMRRVQKEWNALDDFHGVVNFYGSGEDKTWHEYNAKFTDGSLVEIMIAQDNGA